MVLPVLSWVFSALVPQVTLIIVGILVFTELVRRALSPDLGLVLIVSGVLLTVISVAKLLTPLVTKTSLPAMYGNAYMVALNFADGIVKIFTLFLVILCVKGLARECRARVM